MSERPSTTLVLDILPPQGGGACPPTNPPSHAGVRRRSVESSRTQRGREKRAHDASERRLRLPAVGRGDPDPGPLPEPLRHRDRRRPVPAQGAPRVGRLPGNRHRSPARWGQGAGLERVRPGAGPPWVRGPVLRPLLQRRERRRATAHHLAGDLRGGLQRRSRPPHHCWSADIRPAITTAMHRHASSYHRGVHR